MNFHPINDLSPGKRMKSNVKLVAFSSRSFLILLMYTKTIAYNS